MTLPDPTPVDHAIVSRRSIRRFLPDPVPRETVETILDVAARAPSGTNMQPWRVYALAGEQRDRLCAVVLEQFDEAAREPIQEVPYYPERFFEPYLSRRRAVGWALYGTLGIARGEDERMKAQHRRNFLFFDAPVGLMFTIHRDLATGSWLDYGMFLQNIMIAARARGLDTCSQAAWARFHTVMRPVLGITPEEIVVCGMALGFADPDAPENHLETKREPAAAFTTFQGFQD
jgi:nitroreductase